VGERKLLNASVGQQPSLADIVKMVHLRPPDETREASYGWLIGKTVDEGMLPVIVHTFERFKRDEGEPPEVGLSLLAGLPLSTALDTDRPRCAVSDDAHDGGELDALIARRLRDAAAIRRARAYRNLAVSGAAGGSKNAGFPVRAILSAHLLWSKPCRSGKS
jgi:60 kDa SS-A/Ro ribonucleoprotein